MCCKDGLSFKEGGKKQKRKSQDVIAARQGWIPIIFAYR